ncbi:hypothetical protein HDU98_004798, partial [Podochytrium sp. JEL0797]
SLYVPYLREVLAGKRSAAEMVESLAALVGTYGLVGYLFQHGYGREAVLFWLVPVRLSVLLLAYTFDYVPHRPHQVTILQNPYLAIDGLLSPNDVDLSYVLLYQNYHNIHHLYPTIPFYNYKMIWDKYETELKELGTPVSQLYSKDSWFL